MLPRSPYAIAKLAAHHSCRMFRESYNTFACSGILFNHESPRRLDRFVTRKITKYLAKAITDRNLHTLSLGNLQASRDWGYSPEYVEGMWLMLQQDTPDDFVLATGETHTVAEFWRAAKEIAGCDVSCCSVPALCRPNDVQCLQGDASKARRVLGWNPQVKFQELVRIMMQADIAAMREDMVMA